jgi:hypothetical protein
MSCWKKLPVKPEFIANTYNDTGEGFTTQSQDLATAFHQNVMADVPVELNSEWADKLYDLGW